jgi:hypothetical protein
MTSSGPSLPPQRSMQREIAPVIHIAVGEGFGRFGIGAQQGAFGQRPVGRRHGLVDFYDGRRGQHRGGV